MTAQVRNVSRAMLVAVGLVTALLTSPKESSAVPAFSREHNIPCTVCHSAFPKLNQFGIDFKQRGYRMPGDEGKPIWTKPIPLGGLVDLRYEYTMTQPEGAQHVRESALVLDEAALHSGGSLGPRLSYFLEIEGEEGKDFETEVAFAIVDDILPGSLVNLLVGQGHVDVPYLSEPRRLTLAHYLAQIQPEHRGVSLHPMPGVEINGVHPVGFRYAVGARNRSEAFISTDGDTNRLGSFYGWAAQTFAGQTVGLFSSYDRVGDEALNEDDRAAAVGANLDLHLPGEVTLAGAYYWYGEGKQAHGGTGERAQSGLVELISPPLFNLVGVARFDFHDTRESPAIERQYVVSLLYYLLPNVRTVAEYSRRDARDELDVEEDEDRVHAALVLGF